MGYECNNLTDKGLNRDYENGTSLVKARVKGPIWSFSIITLT